MAVKFIFRFLLGMAALMVSGLGYASIIITVYSENPEGKKIGTVKADDTIFGLLLTPNLQGLPAGVHGFHIHEMPSCENHAMAAGGHLDPDKTGQHRGPYNGSGHLGDLPVLIVDQNGKATLPVLAPRLKLSQIEGHSLMIHGGGDNYSDSPEKLGGGGARIACGTIGYAH